MILDHKFFLDSLDHLLKELIKESDYNNWQLFPIYILIRKTWDDYFVIAVDHSLEDKFESYVFGRLYTYHIQNWLDFLIERGICDNENMLDKRFILSGW